jgi:uncharacterized protein (DUF983 family)
MNFMTNFQGIISGKCPKCKNGKIFEKKGNLFLLKEPKMHSHCTNCGYRFEKEPGYFIGSLYVSYGLAVAELLALFILINPIFNSVYWILSIMITVLILLSFFNFRNARTIWIYIFQT